MHLYITEGFFSLCIVTLVSIIMNKLGNILFYYMVNLDNENAPKVVLKNYVLDFILKLTNTVINAEDLITKVKNFGAYSHSGYVVRDNSRTGEYYFDKDGSGDSIDSHLTYIIATHTLMNTKEEAVALACKVGIVWKRHLMSIVAIYLKMLATCVAIDSAIAAFMVSPVITSVVVSLLLIFFSVRWLAGKFYAKARDHDEKLTEHEGRLNKLENK